MCEDTVISATSTLPVESSFEVHSSNTLDIDVCMVDCTHDAAYHEVSDVDTASYHSADLGGKNESQGYHHLARQLKVSDDMIATALEHFDVARQMLATYGWSTPKTNEHSDSILFLAEFHALREAIGIMKQNYLQLLADRDYLLEWDCTCYNALKGKEEEVDELTHELEVTINSLERAQSALRESQSQVEELTAALSLAQSSPSVDTVEFPIAALGDEFTPTGCSDGCVEDVATSLIDVGTDDLVGMSTSIETSREPLVALETPKVSTMTDDAGQIVDSSCVAMVDSLESCVLVHGITPSTSHGTRRVSSGWEYGSHVDLFPSLGSKSSTSSHAADFGCQLVVSKSQSDQLQVSEDKVDSTLYCFYCTDSFVEYLLESPKFREGPFGATKDTLIRGSLAIRCGVGVIVDTLTTMLPDRDFVIGF